MKTTRIQHIFAAAIALSALALSGCATPEKDPFEAYQPNAQTKAATTPALPATAPGKIAVTTTPAAATTKSAPPALDIRPAPANPLGITPAAAPLDIHPTEPTDLGIAPVVPTWPITKGDSLKTTLAAWCKKAGCEDISWEIPDSENTDDFRFNNSITYSGSFAVAVHNLARDMKNLMPFEPVYYTGNRILRILPPNTEASHD